MIYDAKSDRLIMFGGEQPGSVSTGTFNDETWAYEVTANTWTQMKPASAPSKRYVAGLAYDTESDRVILFGGHNRYNNPAPIDMGLTDTWAYDYSANTWKELAKGPANHLGARLAYDAESDRIILFGGLDIAAYRGLNDTWAFEFNTNTWTEMKPKTSPPGTNFQAMTYDSKADRVLVWGGTDDKDNPVYESMWAYDYNTDTWTEKKPGDGSHPAGRAIASFVYNTKADRTILYGGTEGSTETWAYDYNTNTWMNLNPATNPGRRDSSWLAYSPAADRIILFGGTISNLNMILSNETWSYDFNTNTWTNMTPKP
jgi:N-acetylneuraminic acid mutarotase